MKDDNCIFCKLANGDIPVSYTHLDVYKRQLCIQDAHDFELVPYSLWKSVKILVQIIFFLICV